MTRPVVCFAVAHSTTALAITLVHQQLCLPPGLLWRLSVVLICVFYLIFPLCLSVSAFLLKRILEALIPHALLSKFTER